LIAPACILALGAVDAGFAGQALAVTAQSTVTLDSNGDGANTKTLHYEAVQSRTNELTVKLVGANYVVTDTNVNNSGGDPLCAPSAGVWTCPATNVTKIVINLGGGADTADLCQAAGPNGFCSSHLGVDVKIDGGSGRDDLIGAGESDLSRPRGTTTLIGGPGPDSLFGATGGSTIASYDEPWRDKGVTVTLPPQVFFGDELDPWSKQGEPNEKDVLNGTINGVIGSPNDDILIGSFQNNTFVGGGGADMIAGLDGTDTVNYEDRSAPVNVNPDTPITLIPPAVVAIPDVTFGSNPTADGANGENDSIGNDVESITGGSGNDTLVGSHYSPSWSGELNGGLGDDTLDGGPGPDALEGGPGFDTVTYANDPSRTDPVTVSMDGPNADDGSAYDQVHPDFPGPRDTVSSDVESVVGTSGNDTLNGGPNADTIFGVGGNDTIDGGANNDTLSGGAGSDTVKGAGGDDTVDGDGGNDSLAGGDGGDTLNGGEDNDPSLDGGAGSDSVNGGNGTDAADYSSRLNDVSVGADGAPGDGEPGENDNVGTDVEGITGGSGNDSLTGNDGAGTFDGGPGSDGIDGEGGADAIGGGSGFDTADYSGRSAALSIDLGSPGGDGEAGENDTVGGDIERTVGGTAGDTMIGSPGPDVFEGGAGNDGISGAGGQDKVDGGSGDDTLDGGADNDTVGGGEGNDSLAGGDGNDAIGGAGGDDDLVGGTGADTLSGGGGNDTVDYAAVGGALDISFDGVNNDGLSAEADNVGGDVESLTSGSGGDQIDSSGDGNNGRIDCGAGSDSLVADPGDDAVNCEKVHVASSAHLKVNVSSASAKMSKSGSVAVKVACPGAALDPCVGTLTLKSDAKASSSKASKAKTLGKLGSSQFSIAPGQTKSIKVKVSSDAKRTIKRKGKLRASATATASQLDTVSQAITINGPKKKKG
jgi:Ca2+-binding RTX toxin-like protein